MYWLSNIDELRCLMTSLDSALRKEARGIKSQPGGPRSLSKFINDLIVLEGSLAQQFMKRSEVHFLDDQLTKQTKQTIIK